MWGLGKGEIVLVTLVVFLIFGWTWVPRIGEALGELAGGGGGGGAKKGRG
jgi:Sec-independent protein translocase protein TatA